MTDVDVPRSWRLPLAAFTLSLAEMARDGLRGVEGVALWLGVRHGSVATITRVVALRGQGVVRRPDYLKISAELMNKVTDSAIEHGAYLVGQIHSHPTLAGVDLSKADKRHGISVPGYLSVVAPDYAARTDTRLDECGFHIYEQGLWRRLGQSERAARIEVTSGALAPLLILGDNM
jgi:hypothetical protein